MTQSKQFTRYELVDDVRSSIGDARRLNLYFEELNSLYNGISRNLGVSNNTFNILYALLSEENLTSATGDTAEPQGLSQKQIGDMAFIPKQTVNYSVKQLRKQGLVREEPITGRESRLYLTDEGRDLARKCILPVVEAECKAIEAFDEDQRCAALDLFGAYIAELRRTFSETKLLE